MVRAGRNSCRLALPMHERRVYHCKVDRRQLHRHAASQACARPEWTSARRVALLFANGFTVCFSWAQHDEVWGAKECGLDITSEQYCTLAWVRNVGWICL